MNVFSIFQAKPQADPAPQITDADRLAEIEQEYSNAENSYRLASAAVSSYRHAHKKTDRIRVIGERAYTTINASDDPELGRLNAVQRGALNRRNELLAKRAAFLRSAGLIR